MSPDRINTLVRRLARFRSSNLTNPYRHRDPAAELARAPAIRRRNLRQYLDAFRGASLVLVGEAAGYNGCRFSGIPFTGEDLLVGERALPWTRGRGLARTTRGGALTSEHSANIVWGGIGNRRDVVLWNAVPWHPHRPGASLSNRKPQRAELDAGLSILELFLEIFPRARPVAVGRVAEEALGRLGVKAPYVRHPSMGGKAAFLRGLHEQRGR